MTFDKLFRNLFVKNLATALPLIGIPPFLEKHGNYHLQKLIQNFY